MQNSRDVHETFQAETETRPEMHESETETRPRPWAFCPRRDRDETFWIRDETEIETLRVRDETETETYLHLAPQNMDKLNW